MRQTMVVGNWKMNGLVEFARQLASGVCEGVAERERNNQRASEVVLCPPFTALATVAHCVAETAVRLGGQTMSERISGPYTGEISGAMLRDLGCHYVLLGHSERRLLFGESNECVAKKMAAAFRDDLLPIVCLGETQQERNAGETLTVIANQLQILLPHLPQGEERQSRLVLAYEPVWAIGTGQNATPGQAQAVHAFIRQQLSHTMKADIASKIRILYGGSVTVDNAEGLFSQKDVDGGLIGGASLKVSDFLGIVDVSSRHSLAESNRSLPPQGGGEKKLQKQ